MNLLDHFKSTPLVSFRFVLGEYNEVAVEVTPHDPQADSLELVRFWAFVAARILYEIWFSNTPHAFLLLDHLARVFEGHLGDTTDCFKQAEFLQFHYVRKARSPREEIAGEYRIRGKDDRQVRFSDDLPFEGLTPSSLLMVANLVLLQWVVERLKGNPSALQTLQATGRILISQFASEAWPGKASMERLPQAAFAQAISRG